MKLQFFKSEPFTSGHVQRIYFRTRSFQKLFQQKGSPQSHVSITRNNIAVPSRASTLVSMDSGQSPNAPPLPPSPIATGQEQRKFRRIPVELSCLFSADGPDEWSGVAINLSREGCAIRSMTPVQKGDYLRVLLFASANQTPIEVGVAPVRWSANGQFGVEFITLTPRDASRLQDLLTIIGA